MASRRELLVATGIAIGLAGCSDDADPGDDEAGEANGEPPRDGVQLGDVLLQGTDGDEPHSVQIAVEGDTGVVHLDTYSVEPGEPAVHVHREWDDSYTEYMINVRVDGQDRRTIDVLELTDRVGGCADVLVLLDADGSVSVWDRSCAEPRPDPDADDADDEDGDADDADEDEDDPDGDADDEDDAEADDGDAANDDGEGANES